MDMTALDFPDDHFDAAVSAFSIFFVNDMERQLRHVARKVRTGGNVAVTTFSMGSFSPLADIFLKRLEDYGIEPPTMSWKRIATADQCTELFRKAALDDITCTNTDFSYYLKGPEDWWYIIWNAGFRGLVNQLSETDRDRFRKEHLDDIAALSTDNGIRLEMKILYTVGTR